MATIYKITNLVNGKCYIGETLNPPNERKIQHFSNLRNNRHANIKLQYAFNKYGEDNFSFEALLSCPDEERFSKEIELIEQYNSFEDGYNLTPGGDGPGGHHMGGNKNPMYGKSGINNPAFKDYIYKLDMKGVLISIYESSCQAAEDILGYKIERGAKNSKGLCGHIIQCCNCWSERTKPIDRNRFSAQGFQWIRKKEYDLLLAAGYDFSTKRTCKNAYPLTYLKLDEGALDSDI